MNKRNLSLITTLILICQSVLCQSFIEHDIPLFDLKDYSRISEIGDYDNDGDLDIILQIQTDINDQTAPYHINILQNNGAFQFDEIEGLFNDEIISESIEWGDYDNDNDIDLVISGFFRSFESGYSPYKRVYKELVYQNNGSEFPIFNVNYDSLIYNSRYLKWVDFNNDGKLDISGSGTLNGFGTNILYQNTANNSFYKYEISTENRRSSGGSYYWGDFDRDLDMDLIVNGDSLIIYSNAGSDTAFIIDQVTGLSNSLILMNIGDIDSDGLLDIIDYSRNEVILPGLMELNVYHNQGLMDYTRQFIDEYKFSQISLGDYNCNGNLDISRMGADTAQLLFNKGSLNFTKSNPFPVLNIAEETWGDLDNDGDLDCILSGFTSSSRDTGYFKIFENTSTAGNNPPSAPTGLVWNLDQNRVTLSWNKSTDDKTPSDGLSYNIWIGTSDTTSDIFSPMADLETGFRRIVKRGNTDLDTSWIIKGLPQGYCYWSVQAIDNSYIGSEFAKVDSFYVPAVSTFDIPEETCSSHPTQIKYTGNVSKSGIYKWDFGDGNVVSGSGQGPYMVSWDTIGIQTVSLQVISSDEDTSEIITHEILLKKTPSNELKINPSFCQNVTDSVIYTGDGTKDATYIWDFNGASEKISDTLENYLVTPNNTGERTISLWVEENGCSFDTNFITIPVYSVPTSNFSTPALFTCQNKILELNYTGSAGQAANYHWKFDGANASPGLGQGPQDIYWTSHGTKLVSLSVTENNCTSDTTSYDIEVYPIPSSSFTADPLTLYVSSSKPSTISYSGSSPPGATFNWLFDGGTADPGTGQGPQDVTWNISGTKTVGLSVTENGCTSDTSTIDIEIYPQEICMVTVSLETGKNMVVWEKVENAGIASYNIYRETNITNDYEIIGNVPFNDLSLFVDTTSDPSSRSYRYKLSNIDSSGTESALSPYHKSMLLTASVGIGVINLNWDEYEYEGGDFTFISYILYRSTDSLNLTELTTLPSSLNFYVDNNPIDGVLYYRVAGVKDIPCAPSGGSRKAGTGPYTHSLSNMDDNKLRQTSVNYNPDGNPNLKIWPNPSIGKMQLEFSNDSRKPLIVEVFDMDGKIVHETLINQPERKIHTLLDLSSIAPGIYLLKVNMVDRIETGRIIIEPIKN